MANAKLVFTGPIFLLEPGRPTHSRSRLQCREEEDDSGGFVLRTALQLFSFPFLLFVLNLQRERSTTPASLPVVPSHDARLAGDARVPQATLHAIPCNSNGRAKLATY